jgi:hypothetical protein
MHQYAHVPQGKTIHSAIHYKRDESKGGKKFPSSSDDLPGRFVGFSENVGHQMTYKILTNDTLKVIRRSRIKLAQLDPNLGVDEPTGTDTPLDPDIQPTKHHPGGNHVDDITPDEDIIRGCPGEHTSMAIIDANDIIGRSYLQEPEEDGTRHRLRIIAKLDEHNANIANDPTMIQFRSTNDQETYEEIVTYRQILDKLDHEDGAEDEWHFKSINDHQGPLRQSGGMFKSVGKMGRQHGNHLGS